MDLDLWIRLADLGNFSPVRCFLSAAIIHDLGKSQAKRAEQKAETVYIQIKHGYNDIAIQWLKLLLQPVDIRLRTIIKVRIRRLARRFVFWKKRQQVRYL